MSWTFNRSKGSTRSDGLNVVAQLRQNVPQDPDISVESRAQGMGDVSWRVAFPDGFSFVEVSWSEARATPRDMENYCDARWPKRN